MRNFRTEGIVIKRRDLGEADRLLTLFTKEYGKLVVKAAGVRKISSRRSPHIELLNHGIFNMYKGKGMPVLTEVQTIDDYTQVKQDLAKVGSAYHLCELVDGLCPEDQEHTKVFFLLRNMLTQLAQQDDILGETEQRFEAIAAVHPDISDYTIGTYGISVSDTPQMARFAAEDYVASALHNFEIELLTELGYWDRADAMSQNFDTHDFIEGILERKLKSKKIFSKLQ